MVRLISFLIGFCILAGCESPVNHRVEDGAKSQDVQLMSLDTFNLKVKAQWIVGPVGNLSSNNQLLVIIKNAEDRLASLPQGKTLNFYATMPSMGHPLDDPGFFKEISEGIYLNSTIKYNMPGDWKNELWIMNSDFYIEDKVIWHEFF